MESKEIDQIIYSILLTRQDKSTSIRSRLPITKIRKLLTSVQDVLKKDPILLEIPANVHVVGDIHGNIDDLLRIFEHCGYPPESKYLFLGDYIDRGRNGLEVIMLLFALKLKYPNHMYLIRGNHEITKISEYYGFYDEVEMKYGTLLFYAIHSVFKYLPMACLIDGSIFCVHGGIGPDLKSLEDFRKLEKPNDIEEPGLFLDIVWSDPREEVDGFVDSKRGCGRYFGRNALKEFFDNNGLELMIRSHELCEEGINQPIIASDDDPTPMCLTIFSNTDYCGRKNKAVVCSINEELVITIISFKPMTQEEKKERVVEFPKWLLYCIESDVASIQNGSGDSEPNSEADIKSHLQNNNCLILCE